MRFLLRLPSGNLGYYWAKEGTPVGQVTQTGVQLAHESKGVWYEPGDVLKHAWHPVTDADMLAEIASMELGAMTQEAEYLTDEINNFPTD